MQPLSHQRCISQMQANSHRQGSLLQPGRCQSIPRHSRAHHSYSQHENEEQKLLSSLLKSTATASKQCCATIMISAALYFSGNAAFTAYSKAAEIPPPTPNLSQPYAQTPYTAQDAMMNSPQLSYVSEPVGSTSSTPAYCQVEVISQSIAKFRDTPNEAESMAALLNYYKKLGCTNDEINAAFERAYGGVPADYKKDSDMTWPAGINRRVLLLQLGVAALCAFGVRCWQDQPVGWVAKELVEVKPSSVAGKGLFARSFIAKGTPLGAYPGRRRTPAEMQQKAAAAPLAAQYAFLTSDNHYLDPTDMTGQPSAWPSPGVPWPLPIDTHLAYANEPPRGAGGTNCFVEDGQTTSELLFVTNRDIQAGEEIFIDYGITYDRSSYRS